MADFKKAVEHILPTYPVAVRVAYKRKYANIYGLGGDLQVETGPKTGVELRYHKTPKFAMLSNKQREELLYPRPVNKFRGKSIHKGNERGCKRNSHGNVSSKGKKAYDKIIKGQVAAAIKKQRKEQNVDQKEETEEIAELLNIVSSTQHAPNSTTTTYFKDATASAAVKIITILKRLCKT